MSRFSTLTLPLAFVLLLAAALARGAEAPTLDELRKSGVVGERYDGLVVFRTETADPVIRSVVDSVNAKRREIYETRAKQQNAPVVEVGKVYALEIAGKAPPGTWFLGEDGKWTKKK